MIALLIGMFSHSLWRASVSDFFPHLVVVICIVFDTILREIIFCSWLSRVCGGNGEKFALVDAVNHI